MKRKCPICGKRVDCGGVGIPNASPWLSMHFDTRGPYRTKCKGSLCGVRAELIKTADGVEIDDGDCVFVAGPWIAHVEKVNYRDDLLVSGYLGTKFPGGRVDPSICYSTADAASAAWKARN